MASDLGKFGEGVDAFSDALSEGNKFIRKGNKAIKTGNSAIKVLEGASSGGSKSTSSKAKKAPTQTSVPQQTAPQGTSVLDSPIQNGYYTIPAPTGTRLIISQEMSSTGQERYLGAHALESIMNLMQGNEKCGNIVVLDKTKKPSALYYSSDAEGNIYLKGTNKKINLQADGSNASVILSEEEFAHIKEALQTKTNDVTYFKTTQERGDAEDSRAESGSWFSRNWWKILLGLVIAGGIAWGGIAIYNNRQEKKEEKKLQQAIQNAQANENSNTNTSVNQASVASANTGLTGTNITNEQINTQTNLTNQGNSL